jgi:hypothetical protein
MYEEYDTMTMVQLRVIAKQHSIKSSKLRKVDLVQNIKTLLIKQDIYKGLKALEQL